VGREKGRGGAGHHAAVKRGRRAERAEGVRSATKPGRGRGGCGRVMQEAGERGKRGR
jgi:hypothetical protein